MKKLFSTALIAVALFAASQSFAQTHKDTTLVQKAGTTAKKGWKATKKTASKVGNKTAQIASTGAAAVVDKNSYYYYVNKKGRHVYVKESALVAKP